jgi:DNA-binding GntR family transcriptional regulator
MLQSEGFIDSQPNQRVRVSQVSVAELEQLYCMRLALESLAVRIAVPRMTSDDLAELRRLLNLMDEFRAAGDLSAWHGPHKEFHRRLVRHAGESISEVVGGLQARSDRYQHMYVSSGPLTWAATAPEHAAIAAACEHGDAASAANELARHLARTALTGVAVMAPEHDPHAIRDALSQAMISTTAPPRSNKS